MHTFKIVFGTSYLYVSPTILTCMSIGGFSKTPTTIVLFWAILRGGKPCLPKLSNLIQSHKKYQLHKVNTYPTYVWNCKPKYLLLTVHGCLWAHHHHTRGCRLLPSTRKQTPRYPHSHFTIKSISGQTRLTTSNTRTVASLFKANKLTWSSLRSNSPSTIHILLQKL